MSTRRLLRFLWTCLGISGLLWLSTSAHAQEPKGDLQGMISFFSDSLGAEATKQLLRSSSGTMAMIGEAQGSQKKSASHNGKTDRWAARRVKAPNQNFNPPGKLFDDFNFEKSHKRAFPVKIYDAKNSAANSEMKTWNLLFAFEDDGDFAFGEILGDPRKDTEVEAKRISYMLKGDKVYIMGGELNQTYRVGKFGKEVVLVKTGDPLPDGFENLTIGMIKAQIEKEKKQAWQKSSGAVVDETKLSGAHSGSSPISAPPKQH